MPDKCGEVSLLERVCRAQSDRLASLNREVHALRNAVFQTDAALVNAARRWADGPVDEKAVAEWFNAQGFEDVCVDEPIQLTWEGLHEWHRSLILKAAQHFGAPPTV
jgi:hypothetical protein